MVVRGTFLLLPVCLLFSCVTYNARIGEYYNQIRDNNYAKADLALEHSKILKTRRNRLLYLLEKGKTTHLLRQYDSSNSYLNQADYYIEDVRTSAKDIALGTLLNPMMETYRGEDFEKFMVHYYKALNYLYLGNSDEALVEARRITLQSYDQQQKSNRENRYSDDAFSLMLQGIIYEKNGDINNAFISYRNAVDIFLKNNNRYYGIELPDQLKKDLLRTAAQNGFTDQVQQYEKLLNTTYHPKPPAAGGEVVVFWENGLAPVKEEENFSFVLTKDGLGNFTFVDATGSFNIPFNFSATNIQETDLKLSDLRSFRVAFPKYIEQPPYYRDAMLTVNNKDYTFEGAEDVNTIAFSTLKERFLKEMGIALSRLVVKKLAEIAVRPKEDDKNKDTREVIAAALQIYSFVTEKADTRNWQSLPHTIHYARVPLRQGANTLKVTLTGQSTQTYELEVEGSGGLQVQNLCTLK